MMLYPLIVVLLVASCHCAPWKVGFGGRHSSQKSLDLSFGKAGSIGSDGTSVTVDTDAIFGVNSKSQSYSGAYGDLNGKKIAVEGSHDFEYGRAFNPKFHGGLGWGKNKKINFSFLPTLNSQRKFNFGLDGNLVGGNDVESVMQNLGFGSSNNNNKPESGAVKK